MPTIMDLCFLCAKDYNCVSVDDKIVSQVEYLLPEITIIQLGIPLRICSVCDGALYAFSKFKQFYVESSRRLETRIKAVQGNKGNDARAYKTSNIQGVTNSENVDVYIKDEQIEQPSPDIDLHTDSSLLYPVVLLGDDAESSQNELNANSENAGQFFIKDEQLDENTIKEEFRSTEYYNTGVSSNRDNQSEHTQGDEPMTSQIKTEVWMGTSANFDHESLMYTNANVAFGTNTKTQNNLNVCTICNAYFLCKNDLLRHKKKIHLRINNLRCGVCKKIFIYKYDLNKHMNLHNGIRNFQCSICKKRFLNKNNLKHHIALHKGQKKISSESNLKNYTKTHSEIKDKLLCTVCHKLFKYDSNFDVKDFTCKNCNKITQKISIVDIKSLCGVKDFQCNICNKTFMKKYHLDRHIKTHSDIRDYQCDICSKLFTQRSHLNTHIKIHYGIKDFECEVCRKSFTDRSTFSKHIKIHSKIKDYICEICSRSFTQKGALIRHMKVHSGVTDFN